MRIALFVHCFFPRYFYGTETYTLDLARNLQRMGHEVSVVTANFQDDPPQNDLLSLYEFSGIPVISVDKNRIPHRRVKETYYQPEMASVLHGIVRDLKPDIAHVTHLINHTGILLEVLASEGVPTVGTCTDFFGFCFTNKLEAADGKLCAGPNSRRTNCVACYLKASTTSRRVGLLRSLLERGSTALLAARALDAVRGLPGFRTGPMDGLIQDIARRPDILVSLYSHFRAIIVPTRFLGRAYLRNGLDTDIVEIRFGVDIQRRLKPRRQMRRPLTIGFIGQIAVHKGPDLLIEAAERALGRSGYEIRLYGALDRNSAFVDRLLACAKQLPVRFLGTFPKDCMRTVLDELDVVAIPSRWYENSPLIMLNALAAHTPVIVSDVEGMTEFVEDGVNGFVFERGSARSLGDALIRLSTARGELEAMSRRATYELTTEAMTEKTLEVYQRALNTLVPKSNDAGGATVFCPTRKDDQHPER